MKFTVAWTEEAKDNLCELFMAVSDRKELTRLVDALEVELARDPERLGESRDGKKRVVMESHIGFLFEVHRDDRLVKVFHVGWLP